MIDELLHQSNTRVAGLSHTQSDSHSSMKRINNIGPMPVIRRLFSEKRGFILLQHGLVEKLGGSQGILRPSIFTEGVFAVCVAAAGFRISLIRLAPIQPPMA